MEEIKNSEPNINWVVLDPPERSRTYHFPNNFSITYENVTKIEVRSSGKHRLETAGGGKAFVSPGWFVLEIDVDKWTA